MKNQHENPSWVGSRNVSPYANGKEEIGMGPAAFQGKPSAW